VHLVCPVSVYLVLEGQGATEQALSMCCYLHDVDVHGWDTPAPQRMIERLMQHGLQARAGWADT
jgi:hypothetical protein